MKGVENSKRHENEVVSYLGSGHGKKAIGGKAVLTRQLLP